MAAVDMDPSAALCLCGVRGCSLADVHARAFVARNRPRRRRGRWTNKR